MLIDDVISGRSSVALSPCAEENIQGLEREIFLSQFDLALRSRLPVFSIDNVHDYKTATINLGEVFTDQYPISISVPMNNFWMEYLSHITASNMTVRHGIWVSAAQREDRSWEIGFAIFEQWQGNKSQAMMTVPYFFDIGANGNLIADSGRMPLLEGNTLHGIELDVINSVTQTAWLALTFLNCKNVIVADNEGRYANRQERRAAERRGDPPLVTYKTLQIEPMKKVLATEGDIEHNGLAKALHICRGHFAEYGPEFGKGKLFGKYEGRFYVPAHVRGNADQGVVHKRYNVKAPKEDAA